VVILVLWVQISSLRGMNLLRFANICFWW